MKTITCNGVIYTCPFFDAMPPLTADERIELKADIDKNGITYPVVVTETNEVIDGHNRLEIAAELGLAVVPFTVKSGLTTDQKNEHAVNLNLHRRHLSQDQKREIIARRLKTDPAQSNNMIAAELKVSDKTVGTVRKALEATSEIPKLIITRGKDGRSRKSKRTLPAGGEAEHEAEHTPATVKKTKSPYPWWSDLGCAAEEVTRSAAAFKRLAKLPVAERSPHLVLAVIEQLSRTLTNLEQRATEGGAP